MKTLNVLFLITLVITGCKPTVEPTLSGTVVNNNKVEHIRVFNKEKANKLVDSVSVTKGTFSANFSFEDGEVLEVRTNDYNVPSLLLFYEPEANYQLQIDHTNAIIKAPENSLQNKYNTLLSQLNPLQEKLNKVSRDTTLSKEELNDLSTRYFGEILSLKKDYIKEKPESLISVYLLKDLAKLGRILSYHELKSFFDIVNLKVHEGNPMLAFVDDKLKSIEATRMIGNMAPDFALNSPDGKVYGINDFKGSYTLVDFWASWCAPCRVANRKIIPLYEKYKDKGFKIVSISFDDNKEKWVKAIEEDNIPWVQISDLKGFNKSEIKGLYRVISLPTTYVLDPEGKVVDQHLKHHELENLLETIYKD